MIATRENGGCHAVDKVLFNGEPLKLCIFADDETGKVIYHETDAQGRLVTNGDTYKTIIKTGKVEITLNPGWRYNTVTGNFALLP